MVYNVLGTAALMAGSDVEIFQARKRAKTPKAQTQPTTGAGHALHRHAAHDNAMDVTQSEAPTQYQVSRHLNGLFKDNRYVDRGRTEDFFYSLMHSTPQTHKMMEDILQNMATQYHDLKTTHEHCALDSSMFGVFLFDGLSFPVTLMAIIDGIQILKQNTDRHKRNFDHTTPAGHANGWSHALHMGIGTCAHTDPNQLECECCLAINHTSGAPPLYVISDAQNPVAVACPICQRKTMPPESFSHNLDNLLYPDDCAVSEITSICGHLASMLALHAFLRTELLRPGNHAPLYNVHITMNYENTLCQGLLLRHVSTQAQELLMPILQMMTYHELWIHIPLPIFTREKLTLMQDSDEKRIRYPLFNQGSIVWKYCTSVNEPGRRINNIKFRETMHKLYSTLLSEIGGNPDVTTDMTTLHKNGIYWPCAGDHVECHGQSPPGIFFLEAQLPDPHTKTFILVDREVKLCQVTGSGVSQKKVTKDRTKIGEFSTLTILSSSNNNLSQNSYHSYRWHALPSHE